MGGKILTSDNKMNQQLCFLPSEESGMASMGMTLPTTKWSLWSLYCGNYRICDRSCWHVNGVQQVKSLWMKLEKNTKRNQTSSPSFLISALKTLFPSLEQGKTQQLWNRRLKSWDLSIFQTGFLHRSLETTTCLCGSCWIIIAAMQVLVGLCGTWAGLSMAGRQTD